MKLSKNRQDDLNSKLSEIDHKSPSAAIEIEKLLDVGADVNSIGLDEESMLIRMSRNGNLAAVELLIDRGADILKTDSTGRLAIHFAAHLGHTSVVDFLLKNHPKEQVLFKNNWGYTALHNAVLLRKESVVECLLKHHSKDQVLLEFNNGRSEIHYAASMGSTSVVELLLKHHSVEQVLLKNNDGWTALHFAASNGKVPVIEVLLKHIPIAQHLEMYQEALGMAKKRNKSHCIAVIEQALLRNSLREAPLLMSLSAAEISPVKKIRNRL